MNGDNPNEAGRDGPSSPEKLRASFERSVENLDTATVNRLRLMRRDALSGAHGAGRKRWRPAGVAAFAVLAVGLAWWLPPSTSPSSDPASIAADTTEAAMLDDDGDLYAWLGDAPVATGSPEGNAL